MRKCAVWTSCILAAAIVAVLAAPARATAIIIPSTPLEFDLSITLQPLPPSILPSLLNGTAQFSFTPLPPSIIPGNPIDVANLAFGDSFTPTPPQIIPLPPNIDIAFTFSGELDFLGGGSIPAGAYTSFAAVAADFAASHVQPLPPNIDIGVFSGTPLHLHGDLIAFDDPVQIGTFDVTVSEVPEPASIAILGSALACLGLVRRRWRDTIAS
jgi:hypothetical protein